MHELTTAASAGAALGLSAGLAPGPLTTLLIAETLRHGRAAGLRVACVPLLSDLPVVVLAVFALARLAQADVVMGVVSLAGAAFVCFLAYESFRAAPQAPVAGRTPPSSLRKGIVTNWLNPHPYLFWMAVGAPLVLRPGSVLGASLFIGVFYACLVGAKAALAVLIARVRRLLLGRWYAWLNRALGAALLALAALLLRDGIRLLTSG